MIFEIALGIILAVAVLFLVALIGPWLIEIVAEFFADAVVVCVLLVSGGIALACWLVGDVDTVLGVVGACVGIVIGLALLGGLGVILADVYSLISEWRGRPSRWERTAIQRRSALGYDAR